MPNIAVVLKDEVFRLARKELRQHLPALKKTIVEQRHAIADLKRRVLELERNQQFLKKQETRRLKTKPSSPAAADGLRFSPKWVSADRKRLGLSAKDYAGLVGVSMLTIYNWEKGKSKPQARQLAALASVRGLGKREALRRLELLEA
ncbi:MAG: helix-turn-helix transcriptional regulator [Planctomycetota bacterium]|nr:helix-turn-helix transcriptional regulator [Planctomycetota bacterium]